MATTAAQRYRSGVDVALRCFMSSYENAAYNSYDCLPLRTFVTRVSAAHRARARHSNSSWSESSQSGTQAFPAIPAVWRMAGTKQELSKEQNVTDVLKHCAMPGQRPSYRQSSFVVTLPSQCSLPPTYSVNKLHLQAFALRLLLQCRILVQAACELCSNLVS